MTRLQLLCKLHNQQGGTIHDFNRLYKTDFILMNEDKFNVLINVLAKQRKLK